MVKTSRYFVIPVHLQKTPVFVFKEKDSTMPYLMECVSQHYISKKYLLVKYHAHILIEQYKLNR
jgi:hypothetical protein